jgi:hypothetical protein
MASNKLARLAGLITPFERRSKCKTPRQRLSYRDKNAKPSLRSREACRSDRILEIEDGRLKKGMKQPQRRNIETTTYERTIHQTISRARLAFR